MKELVLLSFVFVWGCSSTTSKKSTITNFKNVKQSDFKPKRQLRYVKSNDHFKYKKEQKSAFADESLYMLEDSKKDDFDNSENTITKLASLCHSKQLKKAKEEIQANYSYYKSNSAFFNQIGTCFLINNENRKAQLYYNKALDLKKDYSPALNNLGVMYIKDGEINKAINAFEKAIKYAHFSKTPKYNLANIYIRNAISSKARGYLSSLVRNSPSDPYVQHAMAMTYLIDSNYKKANTHWSKIDDDFYEYVDIGSNYSYSLLKVGDLKKARDVISEVNEKKLGKWSNKYNKIKNMVEKK